MWFWRADVIIIEVVIDVGTRRFDEWSARTPLITRLTLYTVICLTVISMASGVGFLIANCPYYTVFSFQRTSVAAACQVRSARAAHASALGQSGGL